MFNSGRMRFNSGGMRFKGLIRITGHRQLTYMFHKTLHKCIRILFAHFQCRKEHTVGVVEV